MSDEVWAIGVDLGGTKVEVGQVSDDGRLLSKLHRATDVESGFDGIVAEIVSAARQLMDDAGSEPIGIGVGVAGQVEPDTGAVQFAPNLDWHDAPLGERLRAELDLPVVVTNDVRAAAWGEWLHGAGKGLDDLVCLFVGTGVGGGIVSGGRMLSGCTNTAGEVGHITVDLNGPKCHCPNSGCLEALAGGWAIARDAREAVSKDPKAGSALLDRAGGKAEDIHAETVEDAAEAGDPLAKRLMESAASALVAGAVALVNAFNPCRLILGGGIIEGAPWLVDRIDSGVHERALAAAASKLSVVRAELHNDAGVIGTAALAIRSFGGGAPNTGQET